MRYLILLLYFVVAFLVKKWLRHKGIIEKEDNFGDDVIRHVLSVLVFVLLLWLASMIFG
jgi:hypothetical protein